MKWPHRIAQTSRENPVESLKVFKIVSRERRREVLTVS